MLADCQFLVEPYHAEFIEENDPDKMRKLIESRWLDNYMSDKSWDLLMEGERLSFYGDCNIQIKK
ncbi:hypothetical protein [Streptomyces hebeiensis]